LPFLIWIKARFIFPAPGRHRITLPFSPLAHWLGLVAPPAALLGAVALVTLIYLLLVHCVKRWFFRRYELN
jgi:hypothetical protein